LQLSAELTQPLALRQVVRELRAFEAIELLKFLDDTLPSGLELFESFSFTRLNGIKPLLLDDLIVALDQIPENIWRQNIIGEHELLVYFDFILVDLNNILNAYFDILVMIIHLKSFYFDGLLALSCKSFTFSLILVASTLQVLQFLEFTVTFYLQGVVWLIFLVGNWSTVLLLLFNNESQPFILSFLRWSFFLLVSLNGLGEDYGMLHAMHWREDEVDVADDRLQATVF